MSEATSMPNVYRWDVEFEQVHNSFQFDMLSSEGWLKTLAFFTFKFIVFRSVRVHVRKTLLGMLSNPFPCGTHIQQICDCLGEVRVFFEELYTRIHCFKKIFQANWGKFSPNKVRALFIAVPHSQNRHDQIR